MPARFRWLVPTTVRAIPLAVGVYSRSRYVLYTNLFWYVVFTPAVALVYTVITEWVRRESEDGGSRRP